MTPSEAAALIDRLLRDARRHDQDVTVEQILRRARAAGGCIAEAAAIVERSRWRLLATERPG